MTVGECLLVLAIIPTHLTNKQMQKATPSVLEKVTSSVLKTSTI